MFNQSTSRDQAYAQLTRHWGRCLTGLTLAVLLVSLPGCISASAPKTTAALNGEAMYSQQPWAKNQPVNITARLNAIQGALGAVQAAQASFIEYQHARADAHNQRQARISAYNSHVYHKRLRAEEAERQKWAEYDAQNRPSVALGAINPVLDGVPDTFNHDGWNLGVAVAGWVGMQDAAQRQIRIDLNSNVRTPPPPKPPRHKKQ